MEKFYLFGKQKSRGSFDDFFNQDKYESLEKAYEAGDYVEGNFIKDYSGTISIELFNVKNPDVKKSHTLNFQNCPFGLDVSDDNAACELAQTLLQ